MSLGVKGYCYNQPFLCSYNRVHIPDTQMNHGDRICAEVTWGYSGDTALHKTQIVAEVLLGKPPVVEETNASNLLLKQFRWAYIQLCSSSDSDSDTTVYHRIIYGSSDQSKIIRIPIAQLALQTEIEFKDSTAIDRTYHAKIVLGKVPYTSEIPKNPTETVCHFRYDRHRAIESYNHLRITLRNTVCLEKPLPENSLAPSVWLDEALDGEILELGDIQEVLALAELPCDLPFITEKNDPFRFYEQYLQKKDDHHLLNLALSFGFYSLSFRHGVSILNEDFDLGIDLITEAIYFGCIPIRKIKDLIDRWGGRGVASALAERLSKAGQLDDYSKTILQLLRDKKNESLFNQVGRALGFK